MNKDTIIPVILSGGSGSRLWPLSRKLYPKQLHSLNGAGSMLQETVARLQGLYDRGDVTVSEPYIVCNEDHRFMVAEQMVENGHTAERIILEPIGRNTAPALTLAALAIKEKRGDGVMVVMPADHVLKKSEQLDKAIVLAKSYALDNKIVTFGIVPEYPATGYGYIETGVELDEGGYALSKFVEKPNKETAEKYVEQGNFLWNSGMFVVTASSWISMMEQYASEILKICQEAFAKRISETDFLRIDRVSFADCPSDSIDYAIMENLAKNEADRAIAIHLDAGWSDIGSWPALWDLAEKDDAGNATSGDVYIDGAKNSYVMAKSRFVAMLGVSNVIAVETSDAILIADKAHAQHVKDVVTWLEENGREEHNCHRLVHRPWGNYEEIDTGPRYKVKRITVKPGASLSLQKHQRRAEHWVVVKGQAKVVNGEKELTLLENESTYISQGEKHRLENAGNIPLEIIEVQSGEYLGEDDIIRFDDEYGR